MKGAIIGDVVGSIYEFNNTYDYNFPWLSKESTYTDDTICTVAIADAFLNKSSYKESLRRWCRKYPYPMGEYGPRFFKWMMSDEDYSTDSYGNGALMRISPLGLSCISSTEALANIKEATTCSHDNPLALTYSIMYTMMLRKLSWYKDKSSVIQIMQDELGRSWKRAIPPKGTFTATCQDTLPLAVYLFYNSTSFEDAIRLAVSYGGDTDTLAAIVGGMAEAYYGVPEDMWDAVKDRLPEEMLKVVDQFYAN